MSSQQHREDILGFRTKNLLVMQNKVNTNTFNVYCLPEKLIHFPKEEVITYLRRTKGEGLIPNGYVQLAGDTFSLVKVDQYSNELLDFFKNLCDKYHLSLYYDPSL